MSNVGTTAPFSVENNPNFSDLDEDGEPKRTGTLMTASAHIITAVIGSGVLSLSWSVAQMGWVAGPIILLVFAFVTWYASTLQAECYRDPVTGKRHYNYREAVRSILGDGKYNYLLGLAQYTNFVGVTIGYTITAGISMAAVKRAICFHKQGHDAECRAENVLFILIFGAVQLLLSQLENFHELSWLSIVAAIMSFGYSFIGISLSIAKIAGAKVAGDSVAVLTVTGVVIGVDVTRAEKVWNILTALGNMAFAYAFSMVLIEVQDTLKPHPPENVVMKKAASVGIFITTFFYMLCGVVGYAAFGNDAPGNFLTGFGFYEPYWLIGAANVFIAIHLVGAYQVFCQPFFNFVETQCAMRWPENKFLTGESASCGSLSLFRLIWRSVYVIIVTIIACLVPFFNDIVGLIGALGFFPLTIFFPIEMYIKQSKVPKGSSTWIWLKILSGCCFIVSALACVASVRGLVVSLSK